jgi:hypothetical protein
LAAALVLAGLLAAPSRAHAFCGFFVSGAGAKLFNDATLVVMMRGGTRTVLSMQNSYAGPPEDFAMVVPVPVVLKEENVKTLPREIFERVDALAAPRLVEFWEKDPCAEEEVGTMGRGGGAGSGFGVGSGRGADLGVTVEATFTVGEYKIAVLSARDSTGLDTWLHDNGYAIPAGAEPYLRPYVAAGSKFFVAKVDVSKVTMKDGRALLSPLRFYYDSPDFALPVRLGLINSAGTQDLIVHVLSRDGRYEAANYANAFIPTNLDVADATRDSFGAFYAALFDATAAASPGAVITEYAWSADSCDPCPAPALDDTELATLGADVLDTGTAATADAAPAPLTGRIPEVKLGAAAVDGGLDPAIARRILRKHKNQVQYCYEKAFATNPALAGAATFEVVLGADGVVASAKIVSSTLPDALGACVLGGLKGYGFPPPAGGRKTTVRFPYTFKAVPGAPRRGWGGSSGFTLTRLHLRYTKDALGEDLVLRKAARVEGGREVFGPSGALEDGARATAGPDAFQARYVIRHAWAGAIACKDPVRGRWGGRPADKATAGTIGLGAAVVTPALDVAHAPRGGVTLASYLPAGMRALALGMEASGAGTRTGTGAETAATGTGTTATAAAATGAGPASGAGPGTGTGAEAGTGPEAGCGCRTARSYEPRSAAALLALAAALWYGRRRGTVTRVRERRPPDGAAIALTTKKLKSGASSRP